MNKKLILTMVLTLALGVGAGMGTMAAYVQSLGSSDNVVTTAQFTPTNTPDADFVADEIIPTADEGHPCPLHPDQLSR